MTTRKKALSAVVWTEVIERNRRIRKLSRKVQRAAKAVLENSRRQKAKSTAAAWKTWGKVGRELTAEVALQHSTLRLALQNPKKLR